MALKYIGTLITDTQVFAMSEGITTTTYNILKQSSLASTFNDGERTRYIIKAGTPVPSNDANCVGLVFENWDVTDSGGPIPIAISGTINEVNASALGITYTDNCKGALKNMNFLGANMESAAAISLAVEPTVEEEDYVAANGLSFTATLSGDTFVDGEAAKPINWSVGLPAGFSLYSVTKSSTTVYTIVVKAVDSSIPVPTDFKPHFNVMAQAISGGVVPATASCEFFAEPDEDDNGGGGGQEEGGDGGGSDVNGGSTP